MAAQLSTQLQSSSVSVTSSQASTNTCAAVHNMDITAVIAGSSPNGSIKLQKSNSPVDVTDVWVDLVNSEVATGTATQTITTAATFNWALKNVGFRKLRAYITRSSGTITANIYVNGVGGN